MVSDKSRTLSTRGCFSLDLIFSLLTFSFGIFFSFLFLFKFFNLLQKYKDIFFQGQEDKNSLSSISNIFTHSLSNSETIETPFFLSLSRVCACFALNLYRRSSESNLQAKLFIFSVESSIKRRCFCPKPLRIG